MSKALSAAYASIPSAFKALMEQMVFAQDAGFALGEELQKGGIDRIVIDSLAPALDNMRLRMRNRGLPVYARTGNAPLVLGLTERPFKAPHQCLQHDPQYGVVDGQDVASCRFCGVPMELMPEPDTEETSLAVKIIRLQCN